MQTSILTKFRERPNLRHLKRLTTKDGIIQHADHEVPDPSFGYSIDDNARALIACLWHYQTFKDPSILQLAELYFHYLETVEKKGGSFHNFVSFSGKLLDAEGSADSIGRAVWALGEVIRTAPNDDMTEKARQMFQRVALNRHLDHQHTRTKAYILLGLLAAGEKKLAAIWADRLVKFFEENQQADWVWFEPELTYANGILPYALARAARVLGNEGYGHVAKASFDWLYSVSREQNLPWPIGHDGWYRQGKTKALYDQQPLEAADMMLAASELHRLTGESHYLDQALEWHGWYTGNNACNQVMINPHTDGILDGIRPNGINVNQGAECIVTYLMAYLSLSQLLP